MERSLVLIKPDAVSRGLGGAIIGRLEGLGLKMVGLKMLRLSKELAQRLYAIHKGKTFFEKLVNYITSSAVIVAVFEGEKAVEVVRRAVGSTDPTKAGKGTIRGDFGLDVTCNAVHAADSIETAEKEIKLFFTKDEILAEKR